MTKRELLPNVGCRGEEEEARRLILYWQFLITAALPSGHVLALLRARVHARTPLDRREGW